MVKYVLQRKIAALFTFLVIIVVVFCILHAIPRNTIDVSPKMDPAIRQAIIEKYHLDEPKSKS